MNINGDQHKRDHIIIRIDSYLYWSGLGHSLQIFSFQYRKNILNGCGWVNLMDNHAINNGNNNKKVIIINFIDKLIDVFDR